MTTIESEWYSCKEWYSSEDTLPEQYQLITCVTYYMEPFLGRMKIDGVWRSAFDFYLNGMFFELRGKKGLFENKIRIYSLCNFIWCSWDGKPMEEKQI